MRRQISNGDLASMSAHARASKTNDADATLTAIQNALKKAAAASGGALVTSLFVTPLEVAKRNG
ncbi:hypothetical protein PINS_up019066 [Pythium insidiosum]|nr:hypothetical protein PINS_up002370 [Pythium insidiosum]GLE08104.1 hypothetical protein PINS_up019066 [Pythium insidiosum]